jgi:hypothetical protein
MVEASAAEAFTVEASAEAAPASQAAALEGDMAAATAEVMVVMVATGTAMDQAS